MIIIADCQLQYTAIIIINKIIVDLKNRQYYKPNKMYPYGTIVEPLIVDPPNKGHDNYRKNLSIKDTS